MHSYPLDIQMAFDLAHVVPEPVDPMLKIEAEEDGVLAGQLNRCAPLATKMVLTNEEPWWLLEVAGNPILGESKLHEAGFTHAFAGAPTKLWVRGATADERTAYEAEDEGSPDA